MTTHKIIENLWNCSNCNTVRILGRYKNCPECGDPRDPVLQPEEKPYLPDDPAHAPAVTDASLLDLAHAGPDWNCGHCGTANRGDAKVCSSCGRELDGDDTVNRTITYDNSGSYDPAPNTTLERVEDELEEATRLVEGKGKAPRRLNNLRRPAAALRRKKGEMEDRVDQWVAAAKEKDRLNELPPWQRVYLEHSSAVHWAMGAAGILVLGLSLFFGIRHFTATEPGSVTVQELSWERRVEVEQYTTLSDSGWEHPSDAFGISTQREIRSYQTVHDGWHDEEYTDYETRYRDVDYDYDCNGHTEDLGNGFSEYVYDTCTGTRQESYEVPVTKYRRVEDTHEEPVYDTKYYYLINRWVTERWITAEGSTPEGVHWPEVMDLSHNDTPGDQVGEERQGNDRRSTYTIVYVDQNGKEHSSTSSDSDLWSHLEVGEEVDADYRAHNGQLASVDWDSAMEETTG